MIEVDGFSFRASCLIADCNVCKVKNSQSSCRLSFQLQSNCIVCTYQLHRSCIVFTCLFFCILCISSHILSVAFASFTFVFSTFISPKSYRTENLTGFLCMSPVPFFLGHKLQKVPLRSKANRKNQKNLKQTSISKNWTSWKT